MLGAPGAYLPQPSSTEKHGNLDDFLLMLVDPVDRLPPLHAPLFHMSQKFRR